MLDAGRLFWRWTGVITDLLEFMLLKGDPNQDVTEVVLMEDSVLNEGEVDEKGTSSAIQN
jgi:hypothetical protein